MRTQYCRSLYPWYDSAFFIVLAYTCFSASSTRAKGTSAISNMRSVCGVQIGVNFISRTNEEGQSTHLLSCVAVVYHIEETMVRHCVACLRRESDAAFYCRSTSQVYDREVCIVHCSEQSARPHNSRWNDTHIQPEFQGRGCNEESLVWGSPACWRLRVQNSQRWADIQRLARDSQVRPL